MATLDLGKIKLVNRGTWASGTTYTEDDLVQYTDGAVTSTYICVVSSSQGHTPSSSGTTHASWDFLAKGQEALPSQSGQSGKFLTTNGSSLSFDDAGGGFQSKQTFSSSGTHTYTKPSGISKIKVYITGAGASGAGGANQSDDYGGGGGAGGTAIKYLDATSINTVTVTIGAGGGGVSNENNGNAGGTSSFGSHCSASGGNIGKHGNAGQVRGGKGGVGSGGDINLVGNPGGCGDDGATIHYAGGHGGGSFFNGGGVGLNRNQNNGGQNGSHGGGGGGAADSNTSGSGGNGFCLVEEFK